MSDEKIQIGCCMYTQTEIDEIERKYGVGFLAMNPHYPFIGQYTYPSGITTFGLVTLEDQERMLRGEAVQDPDRLFFLSVLKDLTAAEEQSDEP